MSIKHGEPPYPNGLKPNKTKSDAYTTGRHLANPSANPYFNKNHSANCSLAAKVREFCFLDKVLRLLFSRFASRHYHVALASKAFLSLNRKTNIAKRLAHGCCAAPGGRRGVFGSKRL